MNDRTLASPDLPDWAWDWLSRPRLGPYVAAAGACGALELYAWNCRASVALFELIGWFEVGWRNNIDSAIRASRSPDQPHWLFDRRFPLQPKTWAKVAVAVNTVRHRTIRPTPDQVIAELTLGFWRFTARGYWTTVWRTYLSRAFPHAPGPPHAASMDRQLDRIIKLRNRIAHHEPIGAVAAVRETVADMFTIGHWICPAMAAWWRERTSVLDVLAGRP
jgi:hypothetical protein